MPIERPRSCSVARPRGRAPRRRSRSRARRSLRAGLRRTPPDAHLREVLAETAESLLNRHLETAQEWHPHALIPWSAAEDFPEDYEWSPEEMKISAPVRSALFVNVLTEDNLPYYFRDIERMFGRDGGWGGWVRRVAELHSHVCGVFGAMP